MINPIQCTDHKNALQFTNMFLLMHSSNMSELSIRTEVEYRLYSELKRLAKKTTIDVSGNDVAFRFGEATIIVEKDKIHVNRNKMIRAEYDVKAFGRHPNAIFMDIKDVLETGM